MALNVGKDQLSALTRSLTRSEIGSFLALALAYGVAEVGFTATQSFSLMLRPRPSSIVCHLSVRLSIGESILQQPQNRNPVGLPLTTYYLLPTTYYPPSYQDVYGHLPLGAVTALKQVPSRGPRSKPIQPKTRERQIHMA